MHALLALALLAQTAVPELHLYEFRRQPDITSVVGFISVPVEALTLAPDSAAGGRVAGYEVSLTILDTAGNRLHTAEWSQRLRAAGGGVVSGTRTVENVAFDLHPGRYTIAVVVTDSVSGRVLRTGGEVVAAAAVPLTGDLIVSLPFQTAEGGEAPPGALLRAGQVVRPNLEGRVPWEDGTLSLYTEVYPPAGAADSTVRTSIVLRKADGSLEQATQPRLRRYPAAGGLEMLHVPLSGLQPGEYTIGFRVEFPDTTVLVERPFTLAEPAAVAGGEANPFAEWDEVSLDDLFKASEYVATTRERRLYPTLGLVGKRSFMQQFWARRDPTPGSPNEFYEEYVRRIEYANREFGREGSQAGWATPRGRIYILHGPPAERYTRPVVGRQGQTRPFELWKYMGGRGDKYVFYDEAGFGNFFLVYSTDPEETSMPNWHQLFDPETVEFIQRF